MCELLSATHRKGRNGGPELLGTKMFLNSCLPHKYNYHFDIRKTPIYINKFQMIFNQNFKVAM